MNTLGHLTDGTGSDPSFLWLVQSKDNSEEL